ncbi:MAG: acyl-CoA synthetase [Thermodesulfobacteriota bacterium]
MAMQYKSFEEAKTKFHWNERWQIFDSGPETLNIAHECVDRHPKDWTAIRIKRSDSGREIYTFDEISRLTSQFANMLEELGIKKGDRIAIILDPSLEYYVSFYGTLKRGAVAVPCYSLLGPDGIAYRLRESKAKVAIISRERQRKGIVRQGQISHLMTSDDLLGLLEKQSEQYTASTSANTLALIQFSSGTTGQPKQVLYNHSAASVTAVFARLWLGLSDGDRYMCTSSPAWGHGIWYGTVGPLIFGNGIGAYSGKFDPKVFLEGLEEFEISVLSAIPRVYQMLMECGLLEQYRLHLRRLTYTGSEMHKSVAQYFKDKFGLHIGATYGNTESGPVVLDFAFDDWVPRLGSSGKPMFGVKIAVLDEGGDELPPGQIGEVAVWRSGKWNLMGDFGYFDEDGYFWPQGRSDDVIKSSGYRIGPFEIEDVLEKHPAVQRAAVVGVPHEERGEIVKAFIVLKPNVQGTDALQNEIQAFVKNRLSLHEYPKEIEFIEKLPETPDGKLQRKKLKVMEYEKKDLKLPGREKGKS